MIIVFLGPPGSGKGTQAKLLSEHLGIPYIVVGDLLRAVAQKQAQLKIYLNAGQFVPNEITNRIVQEELEKLGSQKGFIVDGYPRNLVQAEAFDVLLTKKGWKLDGVIYLTISEKTGVARLLGRGRHDDEEKVIRERFRVYEKQTLPLVERYEKRGKLRRINGEGTIEGIAKHLQRESAQWG